MTAPQHAGRTTSPWVLYTHQRAADMSSYFMPVLGLAMIYLHFCSMYSCDEDVVDINNNKGKDVSLGAINLLATAIIQADTQTTSEQAGALVNLIISFGMGLSVLIGLFSDTLLVFSRTEESPEERKASEWLRLLSLGLVLRRYRLRLQLEDACQPLPGTSSRSIEWLVPKPGVPNDEQLEYKRRKVSDRCAICLEDYKVGDKIVYSSNRLCLHVFHEKCCSSWLLSSVATNNQCPCCRQTFLSAQDYQDDTSKKASQRRHH